MSRTYTVYEMPSRMVCGNCGHAMYLTDATSTFSGNPLVGATFGDWYCINGRCSDQGVELRIPFKKHEIKVAA